MSSLLDTISSVIVGGIVLGLILTFNMRISNAAADANVATIAQQNVAYFADNLEHDLRKIGYNNFLAGNFRLAESSKIYMRGDFDNSGSLDSIYYYLGATADTSQVNPSARVLYRQINGGTPAALSLGLTRFRLYYYDAQGKPIDTTPAVANPTQIMTVKVYMRADVVTNIETRKLGNGTYQNDTTRVTSVWERTIKPLNIR